MVNNFWSEGLTQHITNKVTALRKTGDNFKAHDVNVQEYLLYAALKWYGDFLFYYALQSEFIHSYDDTFAKMIKATNHYCKLKNKVAS